MFIVIKFNKTAGICLVSFPSDETWEIAELESATEFETTTEYETWTEYDDVTNQTSTAKVQDHQRLDQGVTENDWQSRIQPRIYPQTSAVTIGQFPYYVFLKTTVGTTTAFPCSGALISDTWVVTAAQCVFL